MKTTKGGKVMNPTDAFRKEQRKKELKRNKKERKKVREVGILKKDPEAILEQIEKLEKMKADGALDKARKHKKRQLEDTYNLIVKKRKEYEEKMKEKAILDHQRGRPAAEEDDRAKNPKPEVPASVRVKRESALLKPKPKVQQSATTSSSALKPSVAPIRSEPRPSSSVSKPQSIDDSYMAFLEDMKELGALDE
ncbi:hypothetical protein OsI_25232 [Oryza sativa Indica Group]|uniref:Wbp11/ELF5/Saf1 N-terminal domain-containing protein n=1 Tax=Oryza sativa subsp. indica TaxID=39946 RepID=B8B855_ORYSI|nr:hypothetical protein OsI_25232 [Oryza sativa Indica Group]